MEITTTMVRFRFAKEAMTKKTDKAQLFLCGNTENPTKVWVPLTKLQVKEDEEDVNNNVVTMPKWLFLKTDLVLFVQYNEFVVKSIITESQLSNPTRIS